MNVLTIDTFLTDDGKYHELKVIVKLFGIKIAEKEEHFVNAVLR